MDNQKTIPRAEFNQQDPANLGRPIYWDLEIHKLAIEQMIRADEVQIAIQMLDQIPAWYRQNKPKELEELRQKLYRQLYDQFEYSNDPDERGYTLESVREQIKSGYMFPRLDVIDKVIDELNQKMLSPWIFEISPSHGNLVVALSDKSRMFNFFGKNMNHLATDRFKEWLKPAIWQEQPLPGQPKMLVCFEAIEHMHDPGDAVRAAGKMGYDWDYIFLSVPNGCLGGGLPNWDSRRVGHIRGWNAHEFLEFAAKNWPGYQWELCYSISLVLTGKKHG